MPRVVHFEISADQPERAVKFYTDVFDWQISKFPPMDYWLADTGPKEEAGINGAIQPRTGMGAPVLNTIGVDSFENYKEKIIRGGGEQVSPKTPIPGVGYFAYFKDTEGNPFGLLEPDMQAK